MPILTQATPPSQSRHPWLWALLVVPVLLAGTVAWSWTHPVVLDVGGHELGFGFGIPAQEYLIPNLTGTLGGPVLHGAKILPISIGFGTDTYYVW